MRLSRIIVLCISLLLVSHITFAQRTYFYHCTKRVNTNGVIEKMDISRYYTFSGDSLYESDSEGNVKYFRGTALVYKYCETIDGNMYYYLWTPPVSYLGMTAGGYNKTSGFIVPSDYSVINKFSRDTYSSFNDVYYRTTESAVQKEKSSNVPGLIR